MIVMDDSTCMVHALMRISRFYYAESCVNVRRVVKAPLDVPRHQAH